MSRSGVTFRVPSSHRFHPAHRLNAVCPYYTMFPLDFPLAALEDAKPGEWVLDPFCGRGTTTFAARLRGLPTVGIDADRVAAAIARAKLVTTTPARIEARCESLLMAMPEPREVPVGEFWSLAFHRETLNELCRLREALLVAGDDDDDVLLRAIVLGILHGPLSVSEPNYLSNQMPRTYATKPGPAVAFWRRHGLEPRRVDLRAAVARRARYLLASVPKKVEGRIVRADSRTASALNLEPRFSHVVTSPPYLGMRTYRPDQWLRHWFLGGPPSVDYSVDDMLPSIPAQAFTEELGRVWAAVAELCGPGAALTIRFGSLPSVPADPETVLRTSIEAGGSRWRVETVASAGPSSRGKRQAGQMGRAGPAADEIDLRARLVA